MFCEDFSRLCIVWICAPREVGDASTLTTAAGSTSNGSKADTIFYRINNDSDDWVLMVLEDYSGFGNVTTF